MRRFLGEGAFGRVYEAYDPQLDRAVALKVAKPEQLGSAQRVQRFLREAKAAANLRHPHIVPVFEAGTDGGHHFIAAAFIPGRTLEAAVEEARPDFRRSAQLVRQLAGALAYAHGLGIVHRDVKPANVMLDERGDPLLMDFGLAARQEEAEKLTQDGARMGTPLYMAPEQWAGQAVAASDQYSLGVLLFELFAGQTPFSGTPELLAFLHEKQEPPSPRKFDRRLPRDLETICLKCLQKEPGRRYADCQALADDLRRWLDGETVTARRPGPGERLLRWGRRNPLVAALSLA
ncbi:MAG TPA: serine/threonine-protein kinase, partial [Gemmataceae bacterium]|nr:serine/threonine-protein kinase [Gemmataceae bacterium]